jgi:hypothetical protein
MVVDVQKEALFLTVLENMNEYTIRDHPVYCCACSTTAAVVRITQL